MGKSPITVSIVVPAWNEEKYIGRCIRSLLNLSYDRKNYEVIVVNDSSEDHTDKVLHAFKEEIRIFTNREKLGLPASLNLGIQKARGRYIIRVDADDYVHTEYINVLSMHLGHNEEIHAVCCDYLLVDENEKIVETKKWIDEPIGCGIMFRIENIIELGLYNENMLIHEDKDLLVRFLEKYSIYSIPLPLYRYRRHNDNITNNSENMKNYLNILQNKYSNNTIAERLLK